MYAGVKILLHLFAAVKDKANTHATRRIRADNFGRALSGHTPHQKLYAAARVDEEH